MARDRKSIKLARRSRKELQVWVGSDRFDLKYEASSSWKNGRKWNRENWLWFDWFIDCAMLVFAVNIYLNNEMRKTRKIRTPKKKPKIRVQCVRKEQKRWKREILAMDLLEIKFAVACNIPLILDFQTFNIKKSYTVRIDVQNQKCLLSDWKGWVLTKNFTVQFIHNDSTERMCDFCEITHEKLTQEQVRLVFHNSVTGWQLQTHLTSSLF